MTEADLKAVFKIRTTGRKGKAKYYGRKEMVQQKLNEFREGNYQAGIEAIKLYNRRNEPYRVVAKLTDGRIEEQFSPLISYKSIEGLVRELNKCKTVAEARELITSTNKYMHIR